MSDMNYRTPYETSLPNRKQVARFIRLAKTPDEKKVWRNLLNSEAFIKPKNNVNSEKKTIKKVEKEKSAKKK